MGRGVRWAREPSGAFAKAPNVLANLPVAHQTSKMQADLKLFLSDGVTT